MPPGWGRPTPPPTDVRTYGRRPGDEIRGAVEAWLGLLDDAQRAIATLPFDGEERRNWAYVPGTREGLALGDMSPAQRGAADAILAASLSRRGADEARAVIALESVLGELERSSGRSGWIRRDPVLYWFAVFGAPGDRSAWSWRVGGHHVAIHVTVVDGRAVSCSPSFLGANPAVVPSGPMAGTRTLPGEESLGRALLATLRPQQRRIAVIDDQAPADIISANSPRADLRSIPSGIRYDDLDATQRTALEQLIRHYLDRHRRELADMAWDRLVASGLDDVTFAWAGSDRPGRGHYYAVRGGFFLIEYDNTQNDANHIHAVWRDIESDWGDDVLAAHFVADHAGGSAR